MDDLTGQQLSNYRLIQFLGNGTFGNVYLGEHVFLRNLAAIKLMRRTMTGEDARRFLFEAQILASLTHRHIISVRDFRIERGYPMLVMDYIQGSDLRHSHEPGACLPLDLVVHYIKQIAEALQFAHNQQIIHRDVKPGNVLLGPEQHLYLSDFGLALFAPSPADIATQAGTGPYMAPEQWEGHPTVFSDQYSLAIMVYEWLCGKRPFGDGNLYILHKFEPPQPLRELYPELPEAVEQVVLRALAKEPNQRFISVYAFALALERASQEEITQIGGRGQPLPRDEPDHRTPVQRKLFLTAARADKAFAEHISNDLRQRGIKFTHDQYTPLKQEGDLREAIRASHLVMVVASPRTPISHTIKEHLRMALLYHRHLIFIWASGKKIEDSLPDLPGQTEPIDMIDARNGRYSTALDEIANRIQKDSSQTPAPVSPLIFLDDEPRNPYKGLQPFTKNDTSDFFGRDALIQSILVTLENMLDPRRPAKLHERLLTVVGPSGSGKSSVVMAGVLPRLQQGKRQQGALKGSEKWCYLETLVLGQHPYKALLAVLTQQFPQEKPEEVHNKLSAEHGYGLYQLATDLSKSANQRIVLCIDQFEELFALSVPETERQHFLQLMLNALTEPRSPLLVFLTLRADCYDRPMHYRDLAALIKLNQVNILSMENHEIREAIEQPALQTDVQLFFESDLVGDLLFELQGQEGALPLLEFTLDQLFEKREGHLLTQKAYKEIGGLRGALARHAENVYNKLPSQEQQKLAQTLFLRLIDPGKSEQDTTRRRVAFSELLFTDEAQTRLMSEVTHCFISARLLTATVIADVTSIEVSHEALIRKWPQLLDWLREERGDSILQHTINADAMDWQKNNQTVERLYGGAQLAEALEWLKRHIANANEEAFIRASEAEQRRRDTEEENRLRRELTLKWQTVQRLRAFVVLLSLFLIAIVVFASITNVNLQQISGQQKLILNKQAHLVVALTQAAQEAKLAFSHGLTTDARTSLQQNALDQALLLSVKANQTDDDQETRNSLFSALQQSAHIDTMLRGEKSRVFALAFDPSDQSLVSSYGDLVDIWNLQTKQPVSLHLAAKEVIDGIAVSKPDHLLITSSLDGVKSWNMQTGQQQALLVDKMQGVPAGMIPRTPLALAADGQTLAYARCSSYATQNGNSVCMATKIFESNIHTGQSFGFPFPLLLSAEVNSLTFSANGALLASGSNKDVQIWNVATGQSSGSLPTDGHGTVDIAFSPDGTLLAYTRGNTVQLWNMAQNQAASPPWSGHHDAVTALAFSPDGKTLTSSSQDKTVQLWDVSSGKVSSTLTADPSAKTSLTFSPDGQTLAFGGASGTIMLWNLARQSLLSQTIGNTDGLFSSVFSADGTLLFIGGLGKVFLHDAYTGKLITVLDTIASHPLLKVPPAQDTGLLQAITKLVLSRDGRILAVGRTDGTVSLWDTNTRKELLHFDYQGPLFSLGLSANGQFVSAGGNGNTISIWDVTKNVLQRTLSYPSASPTTSQASALSPDGTLQAVGSCTKAQNGDCQQGQVLLWNVLTGKPYGHPLIGQSSAISDIAFSPDGHLLASSGHDGIMLWDVAAGRSIGQTLSLSADSSNYIYYSSIVFSPDGKRLASYSAPGHPFNFVVWNITQLVPLVDHIQEDGTDAGSLAFSPDGQQLAVISELTATSASSNVITGWGMAISAWWEQACAIANRNLDKGEWNQFVKDGEAYSQICPQLPLGP